MLKILIFFIIVTLHGANDNSSAAAAFSKNKAVQQKVFASKDIKAQKDTTDVIEEIAVEKYVHENHLSKFRDLVKTDRILDLGLVIVRIIIILIIFMLFWKASNRFTIKFVSSIVKKTRKFHGSDTQPLANTAGPILNSILHWVLIGITFLIVLTEVGVDIMPFIYSFGVLGLAISIGSQTLVKDIISGVLTLFEGIVSVGETVEINGNIGKIEGMSLRALEFRHASGKIQVISFSEISNLVNFSRDYTITSIIVPVDLGADLKKVEQTYLEVFDSLKRSSDWKDKIIKDIEITGVTNITESAVYFKAKVTIKPDPYDYFGQEFRKQLFAKMNENEIIPSKFANLVLKVPD